ncbi:MAG: UDP-N-acetylglucosamine 2-epimerase (non-hydrolyzing) [Gammaproteobacteria bacterium]|nr:MAG: UDP-N-acetylglucosamine 2-epimerase (non-hydrolyzing) [Gammaproteobacteria bacterium]
MIFYPELEETKVSSNKKIMCVVGARPNFMKIAPLMTQFNKQECGIEAVLVHTGQHYDEAMKKSFFDQLGIPEPNVDLGVGSGSHAVQTADIMKRFEPEVDKHNPAAVLVVGDVNSTIACGLVAAKKNIPVIHVEAGLRSGDRTMPEEVNRILTDQISDLLYTTEREAEDNLAREGISGDKIEFVGNVMIDTLRNNLANATAAREIFAKNGGGEKFTGQSGSYAILTMHRPANVDNEDVLRSLLETMIEVSKTIPIVFPVHPRTASKIELFKLESMLDNDAILRIPPAGYLEMLGLMKDAKVVLTDSGGIQEETTALGIPCITLRESTERPITATDGTNTIVGSDHDLIMNTFKAVMEGRGKAGRIPEYWDGKTAERIAEHLDKWLETL